MNESMKSMIDRLDKAINELEDLRWYLISGIPPDSKDHSSTIIEPATSISIDGGSSF